MAREKLSRLQLLSQADNPLGILASTLEKHGILLGKLVHEVGLGNILYGIESPDADVTTHAASSSAHHAKYLDAAAIAAVEGEATLNLKIVTATSYGGITEANLLDKTAAESITGLHNFIASGAGGMTNYDLTVGDVVTPDYGIIRIGDSIIGRTVYNAMNMDLDGAFIIRNLGGPVTGQIEFAFLESGGDSVRFALPKPGVGNATYNPRSMLIAGPAVWDDEIVTVAYWQGQGIFDNLVCDTSGVGADLGVQNDLEVEGDIFTDSIKESTPGAGITLGSALGVNITAISSGTTLDSTHHVVTCDASGGSFTVTLPAASGIAGRVYHVKKIDSSGNTVTVDGNASETIDGDTTKVISIQYDSMMIICDGSNWYIV